MSGLADFMTKVNNLDPVHKELFGSGSGVDQRSLPMDPRLKELTDAQRANANEFRGNVGAYKKEAADLGAAEMRAQLAAEMRANATNASSRGLLNSGLRASADQSAHARAASGAANAAYTANQGIDAQADQLDYTASQGALKRYGMEAQNSQNSYADAMERMQNSNRGIGLLSSLGGAAGGMMGGMGGGQKGPAQPKAGKLETGYAAPDTGANYSNYA